MFTRKAAQNGREIKTDKNLRGTIERRKDFFTFCGRL